MTRPMPASVRGVLAFLVFAAVSLATFLVILVLAVEVRSEPLLYAATGLLAGGQFMAALAIARRGVAAFGPEGFSAFQRGFLWPFGACLLLFLAYNVSRLHTGCPLNWLALPLAGLIAAAVVGGTWYGERRGRAASAS